MTRDLALKLRLTHLVTGCVTQKELLARFKRVNPRTGYDPQRAYKWVHGRAAPRDRSVYDDLARVLELPITGETLRTCSFEEFRTVVEARHGAVPTVAPPRHPESAPPPEAADAGGGLPPPRYLAGCYLAVSMAWSATQSGRLILGRLVVGGDSPQDLHAVYEERLPAGDLALRGPLRRIGRSLTAVVRNPAAEQFIFLCFALPPSPAVALAGVMSGAAMHDAEARPVAGRVFCVRVSPESCAGLPTLTGYCEARPDVLAGALTAAGLTSRQVDALAEGILGFVTGSCTRGLLDVHSGMVNAAVAPLYDPSGEPRPSTTLPRR